jgi:hypothetical protein
VNLEINLIRIKKLLSRFRVTHLFLLVILHNKHKHKMKPKKNKLEKVFTLERLSTNIENSKAVLRMLMINKYKIPNKQKRIKLF